MLIIKFQPSYWWPCPPWRGSIRSGWSRGRPSCPAHPGQPSLWAAESPHPVQHHCEEARLHLHEQSGNHGNAPGGSHSSADWLIFVLYAETLNDERSCCTTMDQNFGRNKAAYLIFFSFTSCAFTETVWVHKHGEQKHGPLVSGRPFHTAKTHKVNN